MDDYDLLMVLSGLQKNPMMISYLEEFIIDWLSTNNYIRNNKLTQLALETILVLSKVA